MSGSGNPDQARLLAPFVAFVAIIVGMFVLAGWAFDMDTLTNLVPTWPRMVLLTATSFVASGIALWLAARDQHRAALIASGLVAAAGALILVRYLVSWDAYLEMFSLEAMPVGVDGRVSPRMAPATAMGFVLLGLSIGLSRLPRHAVLHQALALAVTFIAWIGLSRFVFGGEPIVAFVNMAVHTATLLLLLALGTLTLRPDAGIAALLASKGIGGGMARRLLPAAILVPMAAGVLTLYFERRGVFGFEAAVSVFALSSVIIFALFVAINAVRAERTDDRRRAAERALKHSEERNQLIVETALDAVITIDARGLVTGWNSQAEKTFGWTREDVMGRELGELIIPEELREAHRAGLQRYVSSGAARVLNKRIELTALHRNGQRFPVELSITPIGFGDDLMFSAFIRDITARNRAEAALRESEQRFRTTANAAPVLIWMSGPDKLCTWFNQRWLEFVGRSMEQELGEGWCDNLHPADFDRTLDTYHAAFDARRPYEMEYRLQRGDGAWRWLLERATPHLGPTGEFIGYIGTCIDITEHRETVEQLRESRARFKTLAESLPQMIWTCLRDGYCDYLSRQWLDYTGRSEAQQVGSGWLEQVHPDDRVLVQAEWARVVGTGDTYDLSFRIRRFDGVYRWFKTRAVPLRDPAGRILKWFGSNTDIEDFVVAERRLKVQLERMHLLDRTTQAIGAHQDVRRVFEIVLRNLEENLGIEFTCLCVHQAEPALLTIRSVGDRSRELAQRMGLVDGARLELDAEGIGRCLGGAIVYEPDTATASSPFAARLAAAGLRSYVAAPLAGENEVFGVLIVAKARPDGFSGDDSEFLRQLSSHVALAVQQSRLYGALQTAYQDLRETQQTVMQQERLRALGQIASGIAHDINNALSPAALYAQTLRQRERDLSDRGREELDVILRAIDDVSRTVQRMRAFYLPRGTDRTLSPVDLNALVLEVIDLTRARWSNMPLERGVVVNVVTELDASLPPVLGTEDELRDALTNLVLNAVDAMPDGGTITCRTRSGPASAIIVEIQDTGIGMSETTRSRCLEPFFTTKGERGSGLGLPMVYGVAQRHGADVEIDSELGRGTTMRIVFPGGAVAALPDDEGAVTPTGLRLLLVDDDPLLLRSLRDALELDRHEVITAEGGQAGIDAFEHAQRSGERIDAVITDLGMPHVDGRKVARAIRQLSADVPVLMLTGWGHRLIASDDKPEHVDQVLSKPPRMADLRAALAGVVRRAAQPPQGR